MLFRSQLAHGMPADQLTVTDYAKSGEWTYRKGTAGGEVQTCDAYVMTGSEQGLRFEYNFTSSSLSFSGYASAADNGAMDVEMWFDNDRADAQTISMSLEPDMGGFDWRTYRSTNDEPDGIFDSFSNRSVIHFAYMVKGEGKHVESFPLTGSNKAYKSTISCVQDAGAATAAAAPQPERQPYVIKGSCKLVVDGKTYVDMPKNCSIWMANDSSGSFWINTDRDSFLGDYFAEIMPAGDGTASGNWNGEKGATHAQSFLGENFRMGKGGCWSNARATICAAR